jgi:ABC-type glycerol-3-phosphate transport system substrate-binding protein
MKKLTTLIIVFVLLVGFAYTLKITAKAKDGYEITEEILTESQKIQSSLLVSTYNQQVQNQDNYYLTRLNWANEGILDGNDIHIILPSAYSSSDISLVSNDDYGVEVADLSPMDKIEFDVSIINGGLYAIYLDYYVKPESSTSPSLNITINDVTQFTEANDLPLKTLWVLEDEKRYDRYHDELTPKNIIETTWLYEEPIMDPGAFTDGPLQFKLSQGSNKISITVNEGKLLLGKIRIQNLKESNVSYDQYISSYSDKEVVNQELLTFEAEDIANKSRQGIRIKYHRESNVTPYSYKNRLLNIVDGGSYNSAGDSITYEFTVPKSGLYKIGFKYMTLGNSGMPSFRTILIDGELKFNELRHYCFPSTGQWRNEVLQNENGNPFMIYFEEGSVHTITLSVSNSHIAPVYHRLLNTLKDIQDLSIEVNKITGGLDDKQRKWNLVKHINGLEDRLQAIKTDLTTSISEIALITNLDDSVVLTDLRVAYSTLNRIISKPDRLATEKSTFNVGEYSTYSKINSSLEPLVTHPLSLDKYYVAGMNSKLAAARANIFIRIKDTVVASIYSFINPKYNSSNKIDEDAIHIWVNKSRPYVEVMQRMIDEEFTKKTGIKVELSIMPDENKIILANAAGTTPDGVIGISFTKPFEFAIRGIIDNLREYEGFYELASEFNPNTFTLYIYDDGVYAIPETQDVKLLFYRKDILSNLGLTPPDTWQDVISMIPVLQKYDLGLYVPIGEENSYKGTDKTTPFIYQYGGALYDEASMTTSINSEKSYEAFRLMTELFTVYNLPASTANFYHKFKGGTLPVGIGDVNTYIQLKYATPELAGQWGVLPVPGIKNEDGVTERWTPTYGNSSIIFSNSKKKDKVWELIKWWSSGAIQAEYSYAIQSSLGDRYLYLSANLNGFNAGAWPSDTKNVINEQWQWIANTGRVPGDYILERELSNAWNRVVFSGIHPRIAIDDAKLIIDIELERKLEEFGYMDANGNIMKPYLVPTKDNIERWMTP